MSVIRKKTAGASGPNYDVPALSKGLDILECLATARRPLAQSELARLLERTPSEIFRMLNCLELRGYISKDADSGAFGLTLRLFELSHTHSPYQQLLQVARRPMRELSQAIGESCHVGVLHHGELLILAQEQATRKLRMSIEVGSLSPALHTGSGRMLLSYLTEDVRRLVLDENPEYQALSRTQRRRMDARLTSILDRGYEAAPSESVDGVLDVAVPIGDPGAAVQATVAVAALSRIDGSKGERLLQSLLPPMRECAEIIGHAAGLRIGENHPE